MSSVISSTELSVTSSIMVAVPSWKIGYRCTVSYAVPVGVIMRVSRRGLGESLAG